MDILKIHAPNSIKEFTLPYLLNKTFLTLLVGRSRRNQINEIGNSSNGAQVQRTNVGARGPYERDGVLSFGCSTFIKISENSI